MRVGYVLDRFPVLTQTFVRLEIEELLRQGVEVEVFALRRGDDGVAVAGGPPVTYLRELPGGKVRHVAAHARALSGNPSGYAAFRRATRTLRSEERDLRSRRLPALAELVRQRGIDHLHAHFGWAGAAVAWSLAELTGLPWSMTLHGNDLFAQTRNLEAKVAAADRVITVCAYNRRWLVEHHGVDPTVVVCGVEVPEADGAGAGTAEVDVVLVGRLVEKKGVDLLTAAAARLPHRSFEIIGDGPLRSELAAAAPANVRFVGARPHADVLTHLARARILCLPARVASDGDRDSMPLVVKEAMARGVPAVVTDEVGLPEVVDATCGWVVPPEDPAALAAAIEDALQHPDERDRRGRAARHRIEHGFTLAAEVAKLRAAFAEVGETAVLVP